MRLCPSWRLLQRMISRHITHFTVFMGSCHILGKYCNSCKNLSNIRKLCKKPQIRDRPLVVVLGTKAHRMKRLVVNADEWKWYDWHIHIFYYNCSLASNKLNSSVKITDNWL